jgi:type III secretory pathway component EscV
VGAADISGYQYGIISLIIGLLSLTTIIIVTVCMCISKFALKKTDRINNHSNNSSSGTHEANNENENKCRTYVEHNVDHNVEHELTDLDFKPSSVLRDMENSMYQSMNENDYIRYGRTIPQPYEPVTPMISKSSQMYFRDNSVEYEMVDLVPDDQQMVGEAENEFSLKSVPNLMYEDVTLKDTHHLTNLNEGTKFEEPAFCLITKMKKFDESTQCAEESALPAKFHNYYEYVQ